MRHEGSPTHVGKPERVTGAAFAGLAHTGEPADGRDEADNPADDEPEEAAPEDGDVEMDPLEAHSTLMNQICFPSYRVGLRL